MKCKLKLGLGQSAYDLCRYGWLLLFSTLLFATMAQAGDYADSAHANSTLGVDRSSIPSVYATGNCTHCHEQHAGIAGSEPAPTGGTPSSFALFADNFNSSVQSGPYNQADNYCFYCHTNVSSLQSGGGITNKQYSNTFGGYTIDSATDILGTFNMGSYHNLYDIQRFAKTRFAFFKDSSNPCAACHNPHRAKRNMAHPADPAYTAISRPTDHENLWGDDANERMNNYNYRPPYYYGSTTTYEPGGSALHNGSLMPDYNAFCLDCHQYQVPTTQSASMNPNTPAGYLSAINWSSSGDMHGARPRTFGINGEGSESFACKGTVTAPYNVAPVQSNYVLSCLDCHEPHGTVLISARPSSYLLRKEINNNVVDGCGPTAKYFCEMNFCFSCHTADHAGPQGCITCHYHGAHDLNCGGPRTGPDF